MHTNTKPTIVNDTTDLLYLVEKYKILTVVLIDQNERDIELEQPNAYHGVVRLLMKGVLSFPYRVEFKIMPSKTKVGSDWRVNNALFLFNDVKHGN